MKNKEEKAVNTALRSLNYSAKNSYQLKLLLQKKGFNPEEIEAAIAKLIEWNYLNDEDWVRGYIKTLKQRFFGPKLVLQKLLDKQVPFERAKLSLESYYSCDEERSFIKMFLEKKHPTLNSHNDKALVLKKLLRKGFHYEQAFSELSTFFNQNSSY